MHYHYKRRRSVIWTTTGLLLETTHTTLTGHYYEPLQWITTTDHYYRPPQETAYYDNDSDYDY